MDIFEDPKQNEQLARDAQAILDAPAPQVVADERAAFEAQMRTMGADDFTLRKWIAVSDVGTTYRNPIMQDHWKVWQARAALAAAPAQAQEPVLFFKQKCSAIWIETDSIAWLEKAAPELKDVFETRILYRAPVQPVAVPDADLREVVGKVIKAMESSAAPINLAHALGEVSSQGGRIDFDADLMTELLAAYSAAPAAQGDAITRQQIAEIIDSYTDAGTNEVDTYDAADAIIAAIAAKAAS